MRLALLAALFLAATTLAQRKTLFPTPFPSESYHSEFKDHKGRLWELRVYKDQIGEPAGLPIAITAMLVEVETQKLRTLFVDQKVCDYQGAYFDKKKQSLFFRLFTRKNAEECGQSKLKRYPILF